MTPTLVAITCGLIFLAIVVWDVYLYLDGRPRNSISQVVIDNSKKYPMLPWAIGLVMGLLAGHWWW